jgi:dephospho-CoA kinase
MWKIGLTGSIGMGKTTAGVILRTLGLPVHDSDAAVHRAYDNPTVLAAIDAGFPGAVKDGKVDRPALGRMVFNDEPALRRLEAILHPAVKQDRERFLKFWRGRRHYAVAMDVPLLFETGADRECDVTVVVSAPAWLQARRVLARPGMTPERLQQVLARQMPDCEKRKRADIVVPTNLGRRVTVARLTALVKALQELSQPQPG